MVCWALEPASRPGIMEQAASMLATAATKNSAFMATP
jgi:hypothetical protein